MNILYGIFHIRIIFFFNIIRNWQHEFTGFTLPGLTGAQPRTEKPPHALMSRDPAAVLVRSPGRRGGPWRGWRGSEAAPSSGPAAPGGSGRGGPGKNKLILFF